MPSSSPGRSWAARRPYPLCNATTGGVLAARCAGTYAASAATPRNVADSLALMAHVHLVTVACGAAFRPKT